MQIAGELYLGAGPALPDGNHWTVAALVEGMVPHSQLAKTCTDRLNHMKIIPLASNLTFSFQRPGQAPDTISIQTQVISISDAVIDESLFSVPSDYHLSGSLERPIIGYPAGGDGAPALLPIKRSTRELSGLAADHPLSDRCPAEFGLDSDAGL